MAGVWVDHRDHPVRRHGPGDPPRSLPVCGLHVLAGDQGEQPDSVLLGGGELGAPGRFDQAEGIVHEGADDYKSDPAGNAGKRLACGVIRR